MISVLRRDLIIHQGSLFTDFLDVYENGVLKVLTGYTAQMQIRPNKESEEVYDEYDTGVDGGIVINAGEGRVTISVPGDRTGVYDWPNGFYDLYLTHEDVGPLRVMEGLVTLSKTVTRE